MNRQFTIGVFAAFFAAFAFSLNFIVPFIIGGYSTFDFALIRHVGRCRAKRSPLNTTTKAVLLQIVEPRSTLDVRERLGARVLQPS